MSIATRLIAAGIGIVLTPPLALGFSQPPPPNAILLQAPLVDTAGRPTTLATVLGRPAVIAFWTRWCGPCRDEIPLLEAVLSAHPELDVAVVGVTLDDDVEAVRDFGVAYKINYPLLLTGADGVQLLQALGNSQADLPYTIIIDENGATLGERRGRLRAGDIADALAKRGIPVTGPGGFHDASGSAP